MWDMKGQNQMTVDESKMRVISSAVSLETIEWLTKVKMKYSVSFSQAVRWALEATQDTDPNLSWLIRGRANKEEEHVDSSRI